MKVLLDQNISVLVAAELRARGVDAAHAREVGLASASDEEILGWAANNGYVVFTRDADFHALLALSAATHPSVVRIRDESLPDADLVRLTEWLLRKKREEITRGVAITIKKTSLRIRQLPIVRSGNPLES